MSELTILDRFRGCLLGLAAGDALGTTLEFKFPCTFEPIHDIVGGGPFRLKPGQWTDDTSMALCLAESLMKRGEFDPKDQMERYVRWQDKGYLSSREGECFDIGITTSRALSRFKNSGDPYSGPSAPDTAGNGSLMRLAPVPMYYAGNADEAIAWSADSSRTTHGAMEAIDACRYFAGLLVGALNGVDKDTLLSPGYCPVDGPWETRPLAPKITEVASGSFKRRNPPECFFCDTSFVSDKTASSLKSESDEGAREIRGTGYVVESLEAALWAFHKSGDFREAVLLAANLGDDADTTAAICGQIAGAYYGCEAIPEEWRKRLAMAEDITSMADRLYARARQFLTSDTER